MIYFLTVLFVAYFGYTLNFAIKFNRTNTGLSNNQWLLHNFFIWIFPSFWIMIIKKMTNPTQYSDKAKKAKLDSEFYESGIGIDGHGDGNHDHCDGGPWRRWG
jgi:uncharacterized membrane protein